MDELLRELLNSLDKIGKKHEEIYDSECRELMGDAIVHGFVRQSTSFTIPKDFGLSSDDANKNVQNVIQKYISSANIYANKIGIVSFRDRLIAFQNGNVKSDLEGNYFDDFFGYIDPKLFDENGNVIKK